MEDLYEEMFNFTDFKKNEDKEEDVCPYEEC